MRRLLIVLLLLLVIAGGALFYSLGVPYAGYSGEAFVNILPRTNTREIWGSLSASQQGEFNNQFNLLLAALKRKVPQNMAECFALIEREMLTEPWVMGESYTIADAYLFAIAQWLEADGVDMTTLPKTRSHRERMLARAAVQRALQQEV